MCVYIHATLYSYELEYFLNCSQKKLKVWDISYLPDTPISCVLTYTVTMNIVNVWSIHHAASDAAAELQLQWCGLASPTQ